MILSNRIAVFYGFCKGVTDGHAEGQTLLQRCDATSKNIPNHGAKLLEAGDKIIVDLPNGKILSATNWFQTNHGRVSIENLYWKLNVFFNNSPQIMTTFRKYIMNGLTDQRESYERTNKYVMNRPSQKYFLYGPTRSRTYLNSQFETSIVIGYIYLVVCIQLSCCYYACQQHRVDRLGMLSFNSSSFFFFFLQFCVSFCIISAYNGLLHHILYITSHFCIHSFQ